MGRHYSLQHDMKKLRKHVRLPGFDYSTPGAYFVTICADFFRCLFGEVRDGVMQLNDLGAIAHRCWEEIPKHYPEADLDVFQIMPNHMHGVVYLTEKGHSLGNIVGSYKGAVTRQIRASRIHVRAAIWETSYHDHVIRNDDSLQKIRTYIINNLLKWELDRYNPHRKESEESDDWLDILGGEA
jgi:REP element-mobilizing transposase RayT